MSKSRTHGQREDLRANFARASAFVLPAKSSDRVASPSKAGSELQADSMRAVAQVMLAQSCSLCPRCPRPDICPNRAPWSYPSTLFGVPVLAKKNDARHISTQAAHGDSRALDFNVVQVSVTRIYQKRHLFRPPGTLVSLRQTATLKSGARGADSSQVQSGVIFFANTGVRYLPFLVKNGSVRFVLNLAHASL